MGLYRFSIGYSERTGGHGSFFFVVSWSAGSAPAPGNEGAASSPSLAIPNVRDRPEMEMSRLWTAGCCAKRSVLSTGTRARR
jgi:hypothetical protein